MIRTTLIPSNNNIVLTVPESYVGKKIEVRIFDVEEVGPAGEIAGSPLKPSQLRGFLSKETAETMQQHIEQSRNQWDSFYIVMY